MNYKQNMNYEPFLIFILTSSDTESAKHVEGAKDEKDAASVEDGAVPINNNNKKSVTAR